MCNLGWGGGDGRPSRKECPECGKMVRGLKAHRRDAHRRPARAARLWHIRIQRRCEYNGLFARDDWQAYREWLVWPKTFPTYEAAEAFMRECFTFRGIIGHKMSASVALCKAEPSVNRGQW